MTKTLDWNAGELASKFDPRISQQEISGEIKTRSAHSISDITYADIRKAYQLAALVVAQYGEDYLPIFERLQQELDNYDEQQKLVDKAKEIASQFRGFEPK